MFGMGATEIMVILGLALIVIGPKKLPEVARTLGKAMAEFRRSASEIKQSFEDEYNAVTQQRVEFERAKRMLEDQELRLQQVAAKPAHRIEEGSPAPTPKEDAPAAAKPATGDDSEKSAKDRPEEPQHASS
ncbi:MAG: hypothetical protein D6812_03875 [Deltaproteobacteria bacterium]|nr:MAG: hypothetical protein D6812_03875 [Deltaproteobacteria bacterium]